MSIVVGSRRAAAIDTPPAYWAEAGREISASRSSIARPSRGFGNIGARFVREGANDGHNAADGGADHVLE